MQVLCGLQGLFLLFNCQTSDTTHFAQYFLIKTACKYEFFMKHPSKNSTFIDRITLLWYFNINRYIINMLFKSRGSKT